jgi:hypothetical protein
MTVDEHNINECTVHQIVTQNLNLRKLCATNLPKNLNDDRKARRNEVSTEMLERLETEPDFLTRVITADERWFCEYDRDTERQSEDVTRHSPQDRRKLA